MLITQTQEYAFVQKATGVKSTRDVSDGNNKTVKMIHAMDGGVRRFLLVYTEAGERRRKQVSVVAVVLGPNFSSVLTILGHFFAAVFVAAPVFTGTITATSSFTAAYN